MDAPPDPPTLDYAPPEDKPVAPTHPVVGFLGFLVYGALLLFFSFVGFELISEIARYGFRPPVLTPAAILSALWIFTLWRAAAALRGAIHGRGKR